MFAAGYGYYDIVNILLQEGIDINSEGNLYSRTALDYARIYEQDEVYNLLVEYGAE